MSADNVIYVGKIGEEWTVWHDSASNEQPKPDKNAVKAANQEEAMQKACELMQEVGYVEYGIQPFYGEGTGNAKGEITIPVLPDEVPAPSSPHFSLWSLQRTVNVLRARSEAFEKILSEEFGI